MKHLAAVVTLLCASASLARAEPMFPSGSGAGLEPPAGMAVTHDFLGFQKGQASILINELPKAAFAEVGHLGAAMAARLADGSRSDFSAGGATGFLVRGRQSADGETFRKWVVVLDAPDETVMVTVQVPVGDGSVTDAAVEAALGSLAFRVPPTLADKVAALPFTVGDTAGFRAVGVQMGATLVLTAGPKDVDPTGTQPNVTVATSLNRPAPDTERLAFAKAYATSLTALQPAVIGDARMFDAAGTQWAEVDGTGTRGKAHVPVRWTLFMRFNKERDMLVVIGTEPVSDTTRHAERFRTLALSVAPKP